MSHYIAVIHGNVDFYLNKGGEWSTNIEDVQKFGSFSRAFKASSEAPMTNNVIIHLPKNKMVLPKITVIA